MFLHAKSIIGLLVVSLFIPRSYAVDKTANPKLVADLRSAATVNDVNQLLKQKDWTYDFTKHEHYSFAPGGVINANAATFPAVTGYGMSMAILNLGPCSMLHAHHHPRADNFVFAAHGHTRTFMLQENGAPLVTAELTPGQMTIFPRGSLHSMQNLGCDNAQLVSTMNAEDAGTQNHLHSLFQIPMENLEAIFGYPDIDLNDTFARMAPVGTGAIWGPRDCLARCSLTADGKQLSS
ncbi:hypothetical protein W97_03051 [Coniosporium apollinis CBS 100218]|uniref:Cupin type-1 domain-containing protein n=1 Tax=Coniosporium apollinis (strain CBS 100218) TaxID=1168221 RepID=R7YPP3_CONA1|nr:uncharacterized protein W97_03051 [Coniosporium apollinis CBS 100218]EON63823.1 hypothetical protein W97_03051 [Coniosporium apollinis CBS 100218]